MGSVNKSQEGGGADGSGGDLRSINFGGLQKERKERPSSPLPSVYPSERSCQQLSDGSQVVCSEGNDLLPLF